MTNEERGLRKLIERSGARELKTHFLSPRSSFYELGFFRFSARFVRISMTPFAPRIP